MFWTKILQLIWIPNNHVLKRNKDNLYVINSIKKDYIIKTINAKYIYIPMLGGYLIFSLNTNFRYLKKNQIQRITDFWLFENRQRTIGFQKRMDKKLAIF
jgi:hypothetical protein